MQQQVVIVGGGLAGLTAALHLAERGLTPLVLEANPIFAGGRVAGTGTVELKSADGRVWYFQAEHGIHGIWSQYRNLEAILDRHKILPKMIAANRQQWVHGVRHRIFRCEMGRVVRRSWIPAPFHYAALFFRPSFLNMLTLRDCLMLPYVLLGLLVAVGVDPMSESSDSGGLEGRTMAELCNRWPPSLRAFVASLGRSGLSAHPEAVPLSGFIAFMRFYTLLRRDSQAFRYFATDSDTALIKPMIERIKALGGEVRLGNRITTLEQIFITDQKEPSWRVCWQNQQGEAGEPIETSYLILATDGPNTAKILNQSGPTKTAAAHLKWTGALETIVVRAWFDVTPLKTAEAGLVSGEFTIDNFFWLHKFQDYVAQWQQATGGSVVEMHVYGPPEVVAQPNEVIQLRAVNDIQRIFPQLKGHLLHTTIQRNAPNHTLFSVGPIATHLGTTTPWSRLFCCGDWVRHPTPALFLERATVTGIAAANAVLEALGQPAFSYVPVRPPEPLAKIVESILSGASRTLAKGRPKNRLK
jgi:uncharacterized protein with NAD-binding domain and iron-sulfur cluster